MVFYQYSKQTDQQQQQSSEIEMKERGLSRPLHNFELPSTWGSRIRFRCGKVNPNGVTGPGASGFFDLNKPCVSDTQSDGVLEKQRGRDGGGKSGYLKRKCKGGDDGELKDSSSVTEKFEGGGGGDDDGKGSIFSGEEKEEVAGQEVEMEEKEEVVVEEEDEFEDAMAAAEEMGEEVFKPWNLRLRIAASASACTSNSNGNSRDAVMEERPAKMLRSDEGRKRTESPSPSPSPHKVVGDLDVPLCKSLRSRGVVVGGSHGSEIMKEKEKEKELTSVTVTLSKEDVIEDYRAMFGRKPPRRPKKRPRSVRKTLDALFPGLWLSDITSDSYRVPDER